MSISSAGLLNMNFLSTQSFSDITVQPNGGRKLSDTEWAFDNVTNVDIDFTHFGVKSPKHVGHLPLPSSDYKPDKTSDFKGSNDLSGFDYSFHILPSSSSPSLSAKTVTHPYIFLSFI